MTPMTSYGAMPATSNYGNPLMAYVPGGGALPTTTDDVKPAVAKRAVKKS